MYDVEDSCCQQFGDVVDPALLASWRKEGSKQVIHQAELLPAVVCRDLWQSRMAHRRTFLFVDNDAARVALIRGNSTNIHSDNLVWAFHDMDLHCQSRIWVARVPTHSNPADPPSRLRFRDNEIAFSCETVQAKRLQVVAGRMPWEVELVKRDVV
jgi:hypothetical protein